MTDLDKAIAIEVMGWSETDYANLYHRPDGEAEDAFKPSTEIADAWRVVDRMAELGFVFSVGQPSPDFDCGVSFKKVYSRNPGFCLTEHWAHEAICKAALSAIRQLEVASD